jgi:Tol biopolymer transport system component
MLVVGALGALPVRVMADTVSAVDVTVDSLVITRPSTVSVSGTVTCTGDAIYVNIEASLEQAQGADLAAGGFGFYREGCSDETLSWTAAAEFGARRVLPEPLSLTLSARACGTGPEDCPFDNVVGTFTPVRPSMERASVSSDETQGNGNSSAASMSEDGRYVAFASRASNLVPGDTNGHTDVFVRDRVAGTTRRVSVSTHGKQGNDASGFGVPARPVISADGRYVAFVSEATNLVRGDTNGAADVFVRDRAIGKTSRASVSRTGRQSNGDSGSPSLSRHGRYLSFESRATNLVPRDTNHYSDVFVRNRVTRGVQRVSVNSDEVQGDSKSFATAITAHGRFVAFASAASNLVPGDSNGAGDVFVRDRTAGTTERVSVSSSDGQSADGVGVSDLAMSSHGAHVAFSAYAANLVAGDTNDQPDVFLRDRAQGTTDRISVTSDEQQADGPSFSPALSGDGRYVAFISTAPDLLHATPASAYPNVFLRDRSTGITRLASPGLDGVPIRSDTSTPSLSPNGEYVAFTSHATNLVPGDTNNKDDVFVAPN